ncbi:MAG: hypothetical protein CBC13_10565 [Planctomycetia bacterium TMED53]|nr:MAG: hypothetical protein CBC13_10565 [Planctomycetia bacterium TMED53]
MRAFFQLVLRSTVPVNIVFFGLIAYALLVAIPNLPVEVFPNMSFRQVQVSLRYPGASAEEVERLVTKPIENAIRGLESAEYVSSTSVPGRSEVLVKIDDDLTTETPYREFRLRVLSALNSLPQVNGKPLQPMFMELDVDSWVPVIQVMLVNRPDDQLSKRALTLLAKDLRDELERIPGVKRIDFAGEEFDQFQIALNPELLERYGISFQEVLSAVNRHGGSIPAGQIETDLGERSIRVDTRPRAPEDLLDIIVSSQGSGSRIRVADLVTPSETGVIPIRETVGNSLDGKEAIGCRVLKDGDSNAATIRDAVLEVTAKFQESRKDIPFDVHMILDSTRKINASMSVLHDSLMLALCLVISALYFFLSNKSKASSIAVLILAILATVVIASSRNISIELSALGALALFVFFTCRSAVLTVSGIVFAFLGTLVAFEVMGQSINEVSLIGFVLTVGIIVDDAIIVLENIRRQRELGKSPMDAVIKGVQEVFVPIFSATLTTIAAFLPMLLMTGTVGDFFSILPISVATALGVSLFECLIVLPVHVRDLDQLAGPEKVHSEEGLVGVEAYLAREGMAGRLSRFYDRIFMWNQRNGGKVVLLALFLFFSAIGIVYQSMVGPSLGMRPMLKLVFFPEDTSILNVSVNTAPGTGLKETDRVVRELSKDLRETGYVEAAVGLSGMKLDTTYRPQFGHQFGLILAEFPVREERSFDNPNTAIEAIRKELGEKWGKESVRIEVSAQKDGPPTGAPVTVRIHGNDQQRVFDLAERTYRFLREESQEGGRLEGVVDLSSDLDQRSRSLNFIPDSEAISKLGLDPQEARLFVASLFEGVYAGEYLRSDDEIPIKVRFVHPEGEVEPFQAMEFPVTRSRDGSMVRFSQIGSIEDQEEPGILRRRHYQRSVNITGNLSADAIVSAATVEALLGERFGAEIRQNPGAGFSFEGEAESTSRSFKSLFLAFWISLFIIYLILSTQFKSLFHPMVIISNVAFSFTGVVLVMTVIAFLGDVLPEGLIRPERAWITVLAFISLVGLTGIVVNDAIVLVDFIQRRRDEGFPLDQALRLAGHERMRPILMTTISTIAGLLPMSIGIPSFDVRWSPFATVFVAGLLVATMMTLLVVPVLYRYTDAIEKKVTQFFKAKNAGRADQA